MTRECQNCLWWVSITSNDRPTGKGDCHRYPPHTMLQVYDGYDDVAERYRIESDLDDFWPTTAAQDFCGEFTDPKKDKQ